ncbi:hypothetical protein [Sphingomonas sp. JXJ CY 53]|uniref:hypothetical protein n=1 Tax=Sphingomonas lacusdianchii TaxID=2917992 RepID=UPI0024129DF3|nr:hypothetical protein [Sphingomonas sp. JXJ CY 53]
MLDALAEELVLASNILGELAYDLGADETTLRRHMTSLQKIDQLTQSQLAIADVLRGIDDPDAAVAGVTLEEMADRIRAAMAGEPAPVVAAHVIRDCPGQIVG